MKSFSTYINDGEYSESFINESLENNRRIINESVFVHDHYNDINMFMNKFRTYAFNNLYNPKAINESADTYRLTTNESYAFRDFMIYICEEYRSKLLDELNIYESLIVDGELISEGKFWDKLKGGIGKVYQYSKEKIASAIDYVKTKIKEVNDLIREFANKAITSVKDMAGKLIGLLAKFNCTLEGLFKKMGFYSEKSEESVMQIGNELAKNTKENPGTITDNDVITENMQNNFSITLQHVYEDVENLEDTKAQGETVQQAKKKGIKQALWEGFKQLMIWAGTCVVLPGFICAIFPGTFIALLVPLACKLLWNAYKIYKMIKQWKKIRQEWDTYTKREKWFTRISVIVSIAAIIFNFTGVFSSISNVWNALQESGGNLLAQANIGVQPDVLTRGFAALLRMIKEGKFSFEDFGQSFQEITDSFAQHTQISINTMVKRVSDTAKNIEAAKEAFIKGDYTKSMQAINKIKDAYGMSAEAFDKVPIDANVSIFADGSIGNNEWTRRAMKVLNCKTIDELYDKLSGERLVNKGLEAISHGKGGSMTIFNMTKETYLKLRESGLFGAHNINFPIGVVSETTSLLTTTMDVVTAATSMLVTIPSVEFAPQNNGGFRVRLGGPKDKDNFVYEVGKDDIKTHKVSDYQKQYDVIKDKIAEVNKQFVDTIIKNDKISKDKKQKIMDTLKEFNNTYKENINTLDCVVFYGRDVTENTTNESYRSLYNYIINEEHKNKYEISEVLQNFKDLRDYLDQIGIDNNEEIQVGDKKKNTYKGNTRMLLKAFFSTSDTAKTKNFEYKDIQLDPYKSIKTRSRNNDTEDDYFVENDISLLAYRLAEFTDGDNEETYNKFGAAIKDIIVLKNLFNDKTDDIDKVLAAYKRMIDNLLKINTIAEYAKDREWQPKKEWAPLKFDDEDISKKDLEIIKDKEKEIQFEPNESDAKQELEKTGALPPETTDNKDDSSDTSSKSSDNSSKSDVHNDKEVPVLMIANNYCIDLANATKSGPRPDAYSLKGIFDSLTFTMIEGGTSVTNITKMLGEILNSQTSQLWTVIANKPCKRENNKSKYELETYNDANLERPDFGMLTNEEITELLNKPKTAENIIKSKTNNVAIAKTPQDKEMLANTKKEFTDALGKPDDKTIELVKNIDPDAIDKDGNINQDSIEEISDKASQYELAKYQAENTPKKGGLFSKLKNFVRNLFGGNKSEGNAISKLAKYLRSKSKGVNESLYDDLFLEQCFARKSFKEYINESMN